MKAGGGISATSQRSQSHLYTARFEEKPESWSRVGRSLLLDAIGRRPLGLAEVLWDTLTSSSSQGSESSG